MKKILSGIVFYSALVNISAMQKSDFDGDLYDQHCKPQLQATKNFFEKHRSLIEGFINEPIKILDLGCGSGSSTNHMSTIFPKAEICGVDSSESMINKAKMLYSNNPRLRFLQKNVDEMDKFYTILADDFCGIGVISTTIITAWASFHWFKNQQEVLNRSYIGLTNNGYFFATITDNTQMSNGLYLALAQEMLSQKWKHKFPFPAGFTAQNVLSLFMKDTVKPCSKDSLEEMLKIARFTNITIEPIAMECNFETKQNLVNHVKSILLGIDKFVKMIGDDIDAFLNDAIDSYVASDPNSLKYVAKYLEVVAF